MKMKSFSMLAMSGLLAASFAHSTPVMADEMSNDEQSMQVLAENNTQQDQTSNVVQTDSSATQTNAGTAGTAQSTNNTPSTSAVGQSNNLPQSDSNATVPPETDSANKNTSTSATSTADEGSPDTATGDEDY